MSFQDELNALLGPASHPPGEGSAVHAPATVAAVAGVSGGGIAHDGAKAFSELALWSPPLRSVNADVLPEKGVLDAKTRDLFRNDAFLSGAMVTHKDSIVGARFMLNARPATKILWGKEDDTWEEEFQEEIETRFDLWAESPHGWPDVGKRNTLTATVRLGVGVDLAGGEVLGLARWMPNDGRPYRTAFQMIDPDRLSDPLTQAFVYPNPRLRRGIEVDDFGAPVAAWIRNSHPSDGPFHDYSDMKRNEWTRVPWNRPWGRQNILHIFEQMRPEQARGISIASSSLNEMKMTKHFRKAQLQRATLAASYAMALEAELPQDTTQALGVGYAADGNATTQWMLDYLAAVQEYSGGAKNLHVDGVQIPMLPPGSKLSVQNTGATGPNDAEYEISLLRYSAAALGLPLEEFIHDFRQTNYSSVRAALGRMWVSMQVRKRMVAERIANFIYRLWLEEAINRNEIESLKRRNVPSFYEGLNAEAYSACEWIGSGRGTIDPLKETQADILALKAGIETKEAVIARRSGADYRRVARQIARERKLDASFKNPSVYDADSKNVQNSLTASPRDGAAA